MRACIQSYSRSCESRSSYIAKQICEQLESFSLSIIMDRLGLINKERYAHSVKWAWHIVENHLENYNSKASSIERPNERCSYKC